MTWIRWVIVALAAWEAAYMVFDGLRALLVGDYATPKSGPYAGKLGPWANLVSAIGLDPRSTLMKAIFVAYGSLWLGIAAAFAAGVSWAWAAMLVAAIGSLWYLIPGTIVSLIVIGLLFLPRART